MNAQMYMALFFSLFAVALYIQRRRRRKEDDKQDTPAES